LGDRAGALPPDSVGGIAADAAPAETEPPRNQRNYSITDADKVGLGSLKQKCRVNLAAIELLKQLEGEGGAPTDDERRLLVRYVGWGGLPQVFDAWNDEWQAERERLEQLLTPDELDSARATTLNAHYTAPAIIRAMYALLQRLGFAQGRILEPACGLGHFIGLMPEEMHARSRITGIEIDSVTARLARLLYPDADIRHQPFEETRLADEQFHGNVEALRQMQPTDLNATEIDARLGSTWIPAADIQQFAGEVLGEEGVTVSHAPQLGLWVVRGGYGVRFSVANTTEWGTDRRSALELIEDALNLRVPTVYDHDPNTDRDVIDAAATEAARDKQEKLKERPNTIRTGTPGFFNSMTTSGKPLTKPTKSVRQRWRRASVSPWLHHEGRVWHRRQA
jgi:hypothetical protein